MKRPRGIVTLDSSTVHSSFQSQMSQTQPQSLLQNLIEGSTASNTSTPNQSASTTSSPITHSLLEANNNNSGNVALTMSPVASQSLSPSPSNDTNKSKSHSKSSTASDSPPKKRIRTRIACLRCRSRKQKCNGILLEKKCTNCERSGFDCSLMQLDKLTLATDTLSDVLSGKPDVETDGLPVKFSENPTFQNSIKSTNDLITSMANRIKMLKKENDEQKSSIEKLNEKLYQTNNIMNQINPTKRIGDVVQFNTLVGNIFPYAPTDLNRRSIETIDFQFLLDESEFGLQLIDAYFDLMHVRFPAMCKRDILNLHNDRSEIIKFNENSPRLDQLKRFKLLVIYSIGLRLLYLTKKKEDMDCPYRSDQLYVEANKHIIELTSVVDRESVLCLLLNAMFTLRSYRGYMLWNLSNIIMKYCIELNLHRKDDIPIKNLPKEGLHDAIMKRRLFWSCYVLDRVVSINFGKPFSLADNYIDCEMPLSISDKVTDPDELNDIINLHPEKMDEVTDMSIYISLLKLRKIDSLLQTSIYRVDKELSTDEMIEEVKKLYQKVVDWKNNLPVTDEANFTSYFAELQYHKTIRILLLPLIGKEGSSQKCPEFIDQCFRSSGEVCVRTKTFLQHAQHAYSFIALNNVFTSGLTLIYGLWNRNLEWNLEVSVSLSACSTALSIIAERMPRTKTYLRDVFENLLNKTLDKLFNENANNNNNSETTNLLHSQGANKNNDSFINSTTSTPNDINAAGGLAYLVSAYEQQKRAGKSAEKYHRELDEKEKEKEKGKEKETGKRGKRRRTEEEDENENDNENEDENKIKTMKQSNVSGIVSSFQTSTNDGAPNNNKIFDIQEFDELWNLISDQKSLSLRKMVDGTGRLNVASLNDGSFMDNTPTISLDNNQYAVTGTGPFTGPEYPGGGNIISNTPVPTMNSENLQNQSPFNSGNPSVQQQLTGLANSPSSLEFSDDIYENLNFHFGF